MKHGLLQGSGWEHAGGGGGGGGGSGLLEGIFSPSHDLDSVMLKMP